GRGDLIERVPNGDRVHARRRQRDVLDGSALHGEPAPATERDDLLAGIDAARLPTGRAGGREEATDEASHLEHPRTPPAPDPLGERRDLLVVRRRLRREEGAQAFGAVSVGAILALDRVRGAARVAKHEPAGSASDD